MMRRKVKSIPDKYAMGELNIYIDNDYDTYKRKSWLMANYNKKISKGKYNSTLAQRGVHNLIVVPAARKYQKEYGGKFDKATRVGVAKAQTRNIWRTLQDNNFKWKP